MKKEVRKIPSKDVANFYWYSWIEECDDCGAMIHGHEIHTTKSPDLAERDYCISCLRKRIKSKHSMNKNVG